jgi:hypothetical protein
LDFHVSVEIAAPPETVWSVMADVERWHEWTASIRRVRLFHQGPLRVGSRALVRQPRLPPALWTVTSIEPGRSFVWRSGAPGMRVDGRHAIAPGPAGVRVTLALHFSGVLGPLLGRLTSRINNRYLGLEAAGLKRRSEEFARSRNP